MKKFLAILLAMAMLLSLCACGGGEEENPGAADTNAVADNNEESKKEDNDKKKAEKVGSLKSDISLVGYLNGFTYTDKETKLKGIVSYDGKSDTGAKYYDIENVGDFYFAAQTKEYADADDFDALNSTILVDCFGKEIISEGYCMLEKLSDKYVLAAKIVEKTTDSSDYDIRLSSHTLSIVAQEDDILYNAEYYLYDVTTGQKIEGVVSYDDNVNVYGEVINYRVNGEWVYVNSKGENLPEDAHHISHLKGNYSVDDDDTTTTYNAFGEAIFVSNTEEDFVPTWYQNGYFICLNSGTKKLAVFDETEKMVSAEIPYESGSGISVEINGDLIVVNDGNEDEIYTFEGKLIKEINGAIYYNKYNPEYYIITNSDDGIVIIDKEGNILLDAEADDTIEHSGCLAYKEIDGEDYYFSIKDKDFTIKGEDIYETYFIFVENEDDSWEIIDTVTEKTVLKGEGDFDYTINGANVYVCVETEDGAYDFYKI